MKTIYIVQTIKFWFNDYVTKTHESVPNSYLLSFAVFVFMDFIFKLKTSWYFLVLLSEKPLIYTLITENPSLLSVVFLLVSMTFSPELPNLIVELPMYRKENYKGKRRKNKKKEIKK